MIKPDEIKALNDKIEAFKNKRNAESFSSENKQFGGSFAKGFQMSVELIAGVFVGFAIGYFLDFLFNTHPWLIALFTIFGFAAGVLNIYKSSRESA